MKPAFFVPNTTGASSEVPSVHLRASKIYQTGVLEGQTEEVEFDQLLDVGFTATATAAMLRISNGLLISSDLNSMTCA